MKWFPKLLNQFAAPSRKSNSLKRIGLLVESLEDRQLMHAGVTAQLPVAIYDPVAAQVANLPLSEQISAELPNTSGVVAVPAYSSNPGASRSVYLDFNGHSETFTTHVTEFLGVVISSESMTAVTPRFDLDGQPAGFSPGELDAIHEIWRYIAEDYAPFDVNVTTDRDQYDSGVRIAFGGSRHDWYDEISSQNHVGVQLDTPGENPDTVWVFTQDIGNNVRRIADVGSHEAGHDFGLEHQSEFDADGDLVEEYAAGNGLKGPIMGNPSGDARGVWWVGLNEDHNQQDDLAKLADRLGYRDDDHGNGFGAATSMNLSIVDILSGAEDLKHYYGSGIVEKLTDADYFRIDLVGRSDITVSVSVPADVANLDARLELWSSYSVQSPSGLMTNISYMVASADTADLGASLSVSGLTTGSYFVVVKSHGGMGDVGQYKVAATVTRLDPITLVGGTLTIYGTSSDDVASVTFDGYNQYLATAKLTQLNSDGSIHREWTRSFLTPQVASVVFHGYDGNDRMTNGSSIALTADGGAGNDSFHGGSGADFLFGDEGNDTLFGFIGDDYLRGGVGDDTLYGGQHNDSLFGDAGNDRLYGEFGNDTLNGGAGNDTLVGGTIIWSNMTDNDTINGDDGDDSLIGGQGDDWLDAGAGNDSLSGQDGNDVLFAQAGNDVLQGGQGDDFLFGQDGDDVIYGQENVDYLNGGAGNDYLDGGHDNVQDKLVGGSGVDRFVQHYNSSFSINRKNGVRTNFWSPEDLLDDLEAADSVTSLYWN
jgi:Ca2+-binding RTX toxin-like protein